MGELPKTYEAGEVEAKWYRFWMEKGLFKGNSSSSARPYSIVIPPPNVTGILHMGHALNNTIQDVLIRWRHMQGRDAIWVPGTDHAGIATQNVVERELKKEGRTRDDLGREAFLQRVWDWKSHYGGTIIRQLKKMGCSCDWSRERFTMDEGLSRAVREVFVRLYEKGLIYRGNYIINWCPRCGTALSDEESEHQSVPGKLYYIRYPIVGKKDAYVVVATTRPETMLGDVAVAVNPRDSRFSEKEGMLLRLPILEREIPIIRDSFVDPEFGTGAVKITPAHDPNDFEMGIRHDLKPVNVMTPEGRMNTEAGPYEGLDRFACRKRILEDLEKQGLLEQVEEHEHAVGHCYRCHSVVEPRLSSQWFVKMKPLARPAIEAVRSGRVRFVPERWTKVYLEWMENIRDWCISRQIWWGHRIPVFTCLSCHHTWSAVSDPSVCPECRASRISQEEDVLDTWFSSWLWPFSVFGWPEETQDLKRYYPTDTLATASEIIFFWVARMIMAGCEFMGKTPFSTVYIHGTVRDETGRKMSKSLGNSIDPLNIIERYSADALRFSLMMLTATGQDVFLSDEKFELGRNFGTKVWNAARYIQGHGKTPPAGYAELRFSPGSLVPDDQHLIFRLHETIASCTDNLERFRFNDYALVIYDFFWKDFCDWYVEYSKDILYGTDETARDRTRRIIHYVFSTALRLLHPLMPFLTEELWHGMEYNAEAESILLGSWPTAMDGPALQEAWGIDPVQVSYVEAKRDLVRAARTLRADYRLSPKQEASFTVRTSAKEAAKRLESDRETIGKAIRAKTLDIDPNFTPGQALPCAVSRLGSIYMSIDGLVNKEAELKKIKTALEKTDAALHRVERKLGNSDFLSKAPPPVITREKARRETLLENREKQVRLIETLHGTDPGANA